MKLTPPGPAPTRYSAVPGLFRRALTFLAIAFGMCVQPTQAGGTGNQPVNITLAGTATLQVDPPMDGSSYYVQSIAQISGAPQISADFSGSKTLVVTLSAQPGQEIRVTPDVGDTNRWLDLSIQARSNIAGTGLTARPILASAVWETPTGAPPVLTDSNAFFSSYDYGLTPHNFGLLVTMRDFAAFSFTKLTLTFTFPAQATAAFNLAAGYTALSYGAETPTGTTEPRISFSEPASAPTVTTPTSASVAATTATLGGNVTAENTSPITERGVVYSLTSANNNPLISGSGVTKVTASGTSLGVFTVPVTGLTPGGAYSFKAYAINGLGTGYTSVAAFIYAPEIAVERPAGTDLVSGTATVAFGNALIGTSVARTFTVKNSGAAPLTLGAITFTGANAGNFSVTTPPASTVAATNGSTTFTVTYTATATGAANATLSLANNDTTGGEAPFLIALSGTGTGTGIDASFASPGFVTGGWEQQDVFTIGSVGTANPGNNWPATESPGQATDGNVDTKFLIFRSTNAGLLLRPANNTIAYNRLSLTTANDSPERDPATYAIYGYTTVPSTGSFGLSNRIASGTLSLPDDRKAGPTVVQFDNTTAYAAYLLVFESVKNNTNNNLTQIAEVKLSQGMTVPYQVPVGKARGGKIFSPLSLPSWEAGTIRQSGNPEGNNWPAAESPDHALDGNAGTKYLHFSGPNAALGVEPEAGPAVINSVSFWTANDAPERDLATYAVYGYPGSDSPWSGGSSPTPWVQLGSGPVALPPDRNSGPVTVNFSNTSPYQYYAVLFASVKNSPPTILTQISDVAFANVPQNAAPTNITLSNTSIPENNAPGATIGTLTAADPNAGQTHSFSLAAGGADNAAFTITGNTLTINAAADFETKPSYAIRIRATDNGAGNLTFEKNFTITITDVTIPQVITFGPIDNKTFGDTAFNVSATGGASGQPVTFSLVGADPALFRIQGSTVSINGTGTVTVRASQVGSGDYSAATPVDQTFTVFKAPQTITFNPATAALTTDTVTLSATGGASGNAVTFSVFSGLGSIAGNSLTFTGPGAVVVRASQAGSANYLAAANVDRTITASVPVTAPVISSPTSAAILATSATLGGDVTSDGGSAITERGVVYSLTSANANPLISGSGVTKVTASGTTGVFTAPVTGLTLSSGYSFKAYAINGVGTSYTSAGTFTTAAAGESITIGGTTVLSAANIGTNITVPELLTGQTIITGTVNATGTEDSINFTLPPGKAVISGMLTISNFVPAIPPTTGSFFTRNNVLYRSNSAFNTRSETNTATSVAVTAPTRCNTNTFSISIAAPAEVNQQFIMQPPFNFPIFIGFLANYGSASYTLTLEIGDQQTDSTMSNLSGNAPTSLSPAFAPATTLYTSTIPFAQTRVDLNQTFGPLQYLTVSQDGSTPRANNSGNASYYGMNVGLNTIVCRVCAQDGTETIYTVNVTREPNPNASPTFSGYAFSTPKNTSADVARAKILARAADADGGTLSITGASNSSAQGASIYLQSGSVGYDPPLNFTGLDTFTVTISDGQGGTVVGTITVNVTAPGSGTGQNQAQLSILPGGHVALLFQGIPGQDYTIQRSTDLQNWSDLTTVTAAPDGTLPFTDTNPPPGGSAFYRTAVPQS